MDNVNLESVRSAAAGGGTTAGLALPLVAPTIEKGTNAKPKTTWANPTCFPDGHPHTSLHAAPPLCIDGQYFCVCVRRH